MTYWRIAEMVTEPPQLGPAPRRRLISADHARALVSAQFPQWADLPVESVAKSGWDNCTFRLGRHMLVRLPTAARYAQAVPKEHRWLPVLAGHLPLPIPVPLAKGTPTAEYPHPWSVYQWLDGRTASADLNADQVSFATDLAGFLAALQAVDATDGPQPGVHNWYRGGTLRTFDGIAQRALERLPGLVDVDRARRLWVDCSVTPWDGVDRWFHGDMAAGNLLLDEAGHLSAVIDFGTCGVGDPACDLAVAWTLLDDEGRQTFRDGLRVDDQTWTRGRGWALWKGLATAAAAQGKELEQARRTVEVIVND